MIRGAVLASALLLIPLTGIAGEADRIAESRPKGFITDVAHVFSTLETQALETELVSLQANTGIEIAVVILPTLEGLPSQDVALQIGRRWGVGGPGDRGAVVLLSLAEREVRIEVGYGLEGDLPDLAAQVIIEEVMLPKLRDGAYGEALLEGVRAIVARLATPSERTPEDQPEQGGTSTFPTTLLYLFFLCLQWILVILARSKSWWLGGVIGSGIGLLAWLAEQLWIVIPLFAAIGLAIDYAVSRNYRSPGPTAWWAGGTWGPGGRGLAPRSSKSGVGFRGFSGGSFGGGGVRGRW